MTLETILVPVDFSPSSLAAAHLAARIAAANEAKLALVHVLVPPSPGLVVVEPVAIPAAISSRVEAAQVVATKRKLDELAEELGGDIETVIRHGATTDELLEAAAFADLVVVGTEGRDLIPHHVAVELARNGTTPILACPAEGDRAIGRALVAVDFTPDTLDFATAAASLVGDAGLVEVFHVHPAGTLDIEGVNRDIHWLELIAARTRSRATVRGYVGRGQLGPALLSRASEINADLIAIGVEPSDAERPLGLAEELVGQTQLPLLMVPTPAAPA